MKNAKQSRFFSVIAEIALVVAIAGWFGVVLALAVR